ncbi:gamma-glutamyltransferase [Lentzea sp. NPDC051208]|uniref:gamma-glutamyltransferase family protein n=1 Tax=Lentzea sp. NPDC051208 TaxID=3154642 RepID=UPI00342646B0
MRDVLRDRQQWGTRAMVSTGSSAATLAALDVLRDGGTAFDAAITASAVLTVAMPMASGPAGDAAAVFHLAGSAQAWSLTGLGRAPAHATAANFTARGHRTVPGRGIESATTPGLLGAWCALHERHGTLPWSRLLAPAVDLAERGTPVTTQTARWIQDNLKVLSQPEFAGLYGPHTSAVGGRLRNPGLAALYRLLARSVDELEAVLDASVTRLSERLGGFFAPGDCGVRIGEVLPAATTTVAGAQVATNPAPTQGVLLLQNLALYERLREHGGADSAANVHLLSEIVHQTYAWRIAHLGDPACTPPADPLAEAVLADLAGEVDPDKRSATRYAGHYTDGDTTHFAVIDEAGNSVSWTQSLGLGFGTGVGVGELGLLLCNRLGRSATLSPGEPNGVSPGRRPVNTIFAWSAADADGVRRLGGTPGGDGQCQWNTQVLAALLVDGVSPLVALNRPRWTYLPGADKTEAGVPPHLQVDSSMPADVQEWLSGAGHTLRVRTSVGGVLRVLGRHPESLYGLDDGRQEGLTAGW